MTSLLQSYLALQAEARPHHTAVVMGEERLSYEELEGASNQLARLLKEAGCQRGDRICLLMPKTPDALVSMFGTLKADCLYVPIDPSSPAARVEKVISSAEPRLILATASALGILDALLAGGAFPDLRVGPVKEPLRGEHFRTDFARLDRERYAREPLPWTRTAQDAAHLLFTSGSTGTPKGVVITHANVIHFIEWARRYFGMDATDRISGHPPLHFDLSTFDIYGTVAAGAELHLVPPELNLLPHKLAAFIRSAQLTQWFSVPSILSYMVKVGAVEKNDFPALRRLLWCGEAIPTPTLVQLMQRLPHVRFTNLYGPTEATIASSYYTVPSCPQSATAAIPIGTACAGEELLVLDERLRAVAPGETGELYISGIGLSPGYWRDKAKTREAFIHDPRSSDPEARIYRTGDLGRQGENGLFYCLGRLDTQIKSRGYRIELGEVEAALNALGLLKECAVVGVTTEGFEGTAICCAYAAVEGTGLKPSGLRQALGQLLPTYMLPSRWLAFDTLPKNANGKIDRRKLKEAFEEVP